MRTKVVRITSPDPERGIIEEAAQVLRGGGLVAFPTETVYGLGADALNPRAVHKVYDAKGRPVDNPMIVHIADRKDLASFARSVPAKSALLVEAFWPGPLTVVLPRAAGVPDVVTADLDTVAVRMPNHPVALALIRAFAGGIVGPSANISGRPSPTQASHVVDDLEGTIELVLDAGPTAIGVESTVVDCTTDPPLILREGGLARESIEEIVGKVEIARATEDLRRSPGTRHRHYAPSAEVVLVGVGDKSALASTLKQSEKRGKKVGMIVHSSSLTDKHESSQRVLSGDPNLFARDLFGTLRELDALGVDIIIVEAVEEKGVGAAVMERLRKAAQR